MNYLKIAAALRALADAVEEGATASDAKPAKSGGKKATAAVETPAAPPAAEAPAPAPTPSVTIKQVNDAVLKVAAKNRDQAVAILAKFGLANTVGLPTEKWQVVFDAFEEEIAKIDAAAVQVQQASLV